MGHARKLQRAYEHLEGFQREFASFIDRKPYSAASETDAKTGQEVIRVRIRERPPRHLGLLLGDFAHNLRSSLDHLVWALALRGRDVPAPDDATEFPIFITENGDAIRKRIKCIPSKAREKIKALQPYNTPERAHEHPLWILHRLSNIDKHKEIPLVVHELVFLAGTPERPDLSGIRIRWIGPSEEERVFAWPTFPSRTEPVVRRQALLSFAIPFDDARARPLPVNLVDGLYFFVRDKVFAGFAEFFDD